MNPHPEVQPETFLFLSRKRAEENRSRLIKCHPFEGAQNITCHGREAGLDEQAFHLVVGDEHQRDGGEALNAAGQAHQIESVFPAKGNLPQGADFNTAQILRRGLALDHGSVRTHTGVRIKADQLHLLASARWPA